jgi:SAM-dependent methyltransferase
MSDQKFDEAYFQSGAERGTQYRNYLEEASKNRTYFEIAETIVKLFKPRQTLEVGCATGVIVGHLATFDVDAYGIDVSDWAVEHRLHPNVLNASVDEMPFDDQSFDVVYSCHALEHVPPALKDKALHELDRVCRGFQFHMMPILESGPYVGDRFGHLLNLRTDPTHALLFDRPWWLRQFENLDWHDTGIKIGLTHDTEYFELSDCQIVIAKSPPSAELLQKVAIHNHSVAKALSLALNGKPGPGLDVHVARLRNRDPPK